MFITSGDLFAIAIALGTSVALVITSAVQNARLNRKVAQLRSQLAQNSVRIS